MNFLHTDARWTEHFVEVSDPHKEGHHVRFYFERPWVGLTNGEMIELSEMKLGSWDLILEVEAKLKEKNCDNRN
jgi:hypothetical protein